MKKEFEKKVSRREFLGTSGKIIALGALSNFIMIGKAAANEIQDRIVCTSVKTNYCLQYYRCNTPGDHTCDPAERFACDDAGNTCTAATAHYCATFQGYTQPEE